jgi:hypothetical protein
VAIVGESPTPKPFWGIRPFTILEYDTMGIAIRAIEIQRDSMSFHIGRIIYCKIDTSYLLLGTRDMHSRLSHITQLQLGIVKLDAKTLTVKWAYSYESSLDYGSLVGFSDAITDAAGNIYLCGEYTPTQYTTGEDVRGIIFKTDKDGNFIWARDYNNYNKNQMVGTFNNGRINEMFNSIIRTKDNGFILGGSTYLLTKPPAWVVKTDSMGCASSACPSFTFTKNPFIILQHTLSLANGTTGVEYDVSIKENEKETYQISIYPNPFEDKIFIDVINKNGLHYSITNLLGDEVLSGRLVQLENEISANELKPGVYLVSILNNNQKVLVRKIIKQ